MRKIVAVVLAVLMLASVLAMLPASAAAATYDGTTKTTAGLNKIMITEIAPKATYHPNGVAESQDDEKFPLNFIEIYNNNAGDVQLNALSILKGVHYPIEPDDITNAYMEGELWARWEYDKKFVSKVDIKAGMIVDDATAKLTGAFEDNDATDPALNNRVYAMLTNEGQDMTFSNGENVVLWFVDATTVEWMNTTSKTTQGFNPREAFVKSFYGASASAADYTILMVWAYSDYKLSDVTKLADDMFMLSAPNAKMKDCDYIYGIADNTWALASDKAYTEVSGEKVLNEKLYNTARLGYTVPRYNGFSIKDLTVTFGLPALKPYIANAYEAFTEINPTTFNDAFAAGLVTSFKESASIDCAAKATPGTMPAWQWAMVSPETYEGFKTNGAFDNSKLEAAVNAYIVELKLIDNSTGRPEDDNRNYNFQTQEELKNQFYNSNKNKGGDDEGGLSTVVLVIIIVAAVVVVGGGVAATFIIIKKKKAAPAAEAVEAPAAEETDEVAPTEESAEEEKGE